MRDRHGISHPSGQQRLAVVAMTLAVAGCISAPPAPGPFYRASDAQMAGPPGTVLRAEPFPGAQGGASAQRILYQSTGPNGKPIAVSAIVIVSGRPAPPEGRPVIAWAHPTTGIADDCAPSLNSNFFRTIPGLGHFLEQGYVVAATDYPGLGTAGMHPYLVGESEGRAVLDSVRAVQRLPGTQANARFAVWGHSQGGQAALFAGQLAADYAPDLALVGVAAAAPATELTRLLEDDFTTPVGRLLTAYTLWSWSSVYDVPLNAVLASGALPAVEETASRCVETWGESYRALFDAEPLANTFLVKGAMNVAPWPELLASNQPGRVRAGAPLFIAQGLTDPTVLPAVTTEWVAAACSRGERVRFMLMPDVSHMLAGQKSAPAVADWIAGRFAGAAVTDDCANIKR